MIANNDSEKYKALILGLEEEVKKGKLIQGQWRQASGGSAEEKTAAQRFLFWKERICLLLTDQIEPNALVESILKTIRTSNVNDNSLPFIPALEGVLDDIKSPVPSLRFKPNPQHRETNTDLISNIKNIEQREGVNKIFIGHGRSSQWKDLKDFLQDRLHLDWDEFNREPTAGMATKERIESMLRNASFAFVVMTAEDVHADGSAHARENVIHEIGLFQGKLGFRKAIILLEEGCAEFSNITGLTQIRYPKGNITARSEEIRRVLEREGFLS